SSRFDEAHRDWIVNEMKSRGIALGRYVAPIHLQPIYRSFESGKPALPVTEFQAARSLALPFFNRIREAEIQEVCQTLVELIFDRRDGIVSKFQT
ncbi:MAG: DegT/DnrJ/EryC1/StrS family aminotransferase, partial [Candidatus Acidiferrales bacterium]